MYRLLFTFYIYYSSSYLTGPWDGVFKGKYYFWHLSLSYQEHYEIVCDILWLYKSHKEDDVRDPLRRC